MSAFASPETVVVRDPSWEPHEGVTIKKKMNLADEQWIANSYTGMGVDAKGAPAFQASLGSVKAKTIERMLVSWTFTENGNPVALTPANIARLDTTYANYIYEQINQNNQPMEVQAQEDFLLSVNEPIAVN
jgi:hypothetical protein